MNRVFCRLQGRMSNADMHFISLGFRLWGLRSNIRRIYIRNIAPGPKIGECSGVFFQPEFRENRLKRV